jgi:uncharacterized membrane protein YfcA
LTADRTAREWPGLRALRERSRPRGGNGEGDDGGGTAGRGTLGVAMLLPIVAVAVIAVSTVVTPDPQRVHLLLATGVAVVAGLSATTIGVYGGILVPGLLLLGVDPRFAAPLSLLLQVMVIPIGATSHYRLGNVKRSITWPLLVGGVVGSAAGALFSSAVPGSVVARIVAFVIVIVGVIVLASLKRGYAGGTVAHEEIRPARIGSIGLTAGFASGISGAGWGPIGVKLLILSRIEPRHAIGSSLVGRVFMALSAVVTYALTATAISGVHAEFELLLPLLAGSVAAMVPGAYIVSRIGRGRATAFVAILSISLALPTLLWPK